MTTKRRRRGRQPDEAEPHVPTPTYRASAYVVYPTGYDAVQRERKDRWTLDVVDAGNGWAIRRGEECLNVALQWEKERSLALCDAQFVRRCRYNEHAALLRARRVIDRLEVWGLTFDEFATEPVEEAVDAIDEARRRIAGAPINAPANPPPDAATGS